MQQRIAHMLDCYERGRVSRRGLIQGLAALAAAAGTAGAAPKGTFQGVGWNHVALRVTDVKRSRDFYQKHFGLPVAHESATDCFLTMGKDFLTLFQRPAAGLDHFCIAIEKFQPDAVVEELKRQGFTPRRPAGTDRIYFPDPDGLTVQVSGDDHRP